MMFETPAPTASSTPYWMIGLSTSGSISFGCALVAGRNRVPRPAAGTTALRIVPAMAPSYRIVASLRDATSQRWLRGRQTRTALSYDLTAPRDALIEPAFLRDNLAAL